MTAAVPCDPRFRGRIVETLKGRTTYGQQAAEDATDDLLPLIAAEVEARVQADALDPS